jgi:hypothetical protein
MAYTSRILVVARRTAASDDLRDALLDRAARGPLTVTLLMPAEEVGHDGRLAMRDALDEALGRLREAGLEADGLVGDCDPVQAVVDAHEPGRFDEVVVCTLPGASSKWLQIDLPHRIARICDLPVTHVVAHAPRTHRTGPPPHHEREPLGPLGVLAWSGRRD